ncbi:MAG: polysaccharide deacetylase family protein [Chloroflexota bacterium]
MPLRFRVLLAGAAICALALMIPIAQSAPVAAQSKPAAKQVRVPILMYHYVRTNPIATDLVGADLSVDPQSFAREMLMLSKAGMHTITLDDLYAALTQGHALPAHPVILTFDDGYEDFYTAAFPVLQALHMRATSFIITGKAGWKGYMTWDQMRDIERSGLVQFESHTVNHVELNKISPAKAEQELIDSKSTLEKELGGSVKYLAYPSGRFNATVVNLAQAVGYEAAVTTQYGSLQSSSGLLALSRVRIPGAESLWSFALSVWSKN